MSVWKRGGKTNRTGVYYITYWDRRHGQCIKRIVSSGVRDADVARGIEKKLKRLADLRLGGEPTPTELVDWAASANTTLQNHLAKFELIEHDLLQGRTKLSALVEKYLAHCESKGQAPAVIRTKRTQLAKLVAAANDCGPRMLKAKHMRDVMNAVIAAGRSNRTANQHLVNARAFATWLREKEELIAKSPFIGIDRLDESSDRRRQRRAMSTDEIILLLKHAPKGRARVYLALLLTGLRRGEMRQMTWADADFETLTIHVRAAVSKSGQNAELPMHAELKILLLGVRPKRWKPDGRWFKAVPGTKAFYKDLALAGIAQTDIRGRVLDIHALRGTFATRLALQNVPMAVVQKLMRHADIKTTAKYYTHTEMDALRAGVDQMPLPDVATDSQPAVHCGDGAIDRHQRRTDDNPPRNPTEARHQARRQAALHRGGRRSRSARSTRRLGGGRDAQGQDGRPLDR